MGRNRTFIRILGGAVLATLAFAGIWTRYHPRNLPVEAVLPETPPQPPPAAETPVSPPRPVIRYNETDEEFQALMNRRKAEYGMDRGVDMIVREDESLEVGKTVIPMREILDKIRLQEGGTVEETLGGTLAARAEQNRMEQLFSRLKTSESRFRELDAVLTAPDAEKNTEAFREQVHEYRELEQIVADYYRYRDALKVISRNEELLAAEDPHQTVAEYLETLRREKAGMEASLWPDDDRAASLARLADAEARFHETDNILKNPSQDTDSEKLVREQAALRKQVADYQAWKEINRRIAEAENLQAGDADSIRREAEKQVRMFRMERDDIENRLRTKLMPGKEADVYGIYVVRPGDNVWNIHFEFLKEYFRNRGIVLTRDADEPVRPGLSSGVGRILKFSETMLYIYNLREHCLSVDLDQIHPLSKIVVFNMGQAFDTLSRIDYENIRNIRFDGENLWIPAAM